MTPDPATRARDLVAAWRDRDIRLDELLDETINRWLVESLVQDIAAVFTEPPFRPAETRTIDALARAIWARLTIRPAGVGVVPDGDDSPDACERAAREESEYELRVIREGIAAALARPAAQAAAEMRERAATLIEDSARGIRVEAGDAIDDALAARLVQMVASYADDFAAAIRALPIESARPAAPPMGRRRGDHR